MGITVKRPVTVKAIVTPSFKERLLSELRCAVQRLEIQLQQLEFQGKRKLMDLQKKNISQAMAVRKQLEEERAKHENALRELNERIRQVDLFPLGAEFVQGSLESFVQLEVGDNINAKLADVEVIVRDDIIVEIREGSAAEQSSPLSDSLESGLRLMPASDGASNLGSLA